MTLAFPEQWLQIKDSTPNKLDLCTFHTLLQVRSTFVLTLKRFWMAVSLQRKQTFSVLVFSCSKPSRKAKFPQEPPLNRPKRFFQENDHQFLLNALPCTLNLFQVRSVHSTHHWDCWSQDASSRPNFKVIVDLLRLMKESFESVVFPSEEDLSPKQVEKIDLQGYEDLDEDPRV